MKSFFFFFFILVLSTISNAQDPYLIFDHNARKEVNCIHFSPDGTKILAGYIDGTAEVINTETGTNELELDGHWKGVMAVKMDPKGRYIMTAGDNSIRIYNPEGELIYQLKKHTTTIYSADIDSTGKYIISGAISPAIILWDAITGEFIEYLRGHSDVAMAVAFSPDGKKIASGSGDHTIKIWDTETRQETMTLPGHSMDVFAVTFSHNGKYLASCGKDKIIRIYDLETGSFIKSLKGHKNFIMDIEFSKDGNHLVSCSFDKEVRIWELATSRMIYSFIDHQDEITNIAVSPDGSKIASCSYDKTIKIYDFSNEIIVDFYYRPEVSEKMNENPIFRSRQKEESRKDYIKRKEKAENIKDEIYAGFYRKYLQDLKNNELPGM